MFSVVTLPVILFFPRMMRKFSASKMIALVVCVGVVGYTLLFMAKASMPLLVVGTICMGIGQFPVAYLQANIIMQLADYNEYIGIPRMDSSVGLMGGALAKVGSGLGSGLLGILLDLAGYVGKAPVQSGSAMIMIRLLYSIVPMVCVIFMALFATRIFSLDKKMLEIKEKLDAKREKVVLHE